VARQRFDVEVPDGQHLGFSRDTTGARRAHLFDDETNDLVGHAELFELDEAGAFSPNSEYMDLAYPEAAQAAPRPLSEAQRELAEVLGIFMAEVIIEAAEATASHVSRWWSAKVVPAFGASRHGLKPTYTRLPHRREDHSSSSTAVAAWVEDPVPTPSSGDLAVAFEAHRIRMSSAEARERLAAVLAARAFSEEQMKILSNVQIEDEDGPTELGRVVRGLTPQDVAETLIEILERNPPLLDRGTLTEPGSVVHDGRAGRDYVALKFERLKDVPRTMDREPELSPDAHRMHT